MAKKRKASGRGANDKSKSFDFDPEQSKLKIGTYEDVAGSDDEFHLNQEKVLLEEGPDAKRRRKLAEKDAFLEQSDDEILAYESELSLDDDEDDDDESDEDDNAPISKSRLREDLREDDGDSEEDEIAELAKWGSRSSNYYGADTIETEQDAMDEYAEATRLQKKQTQDFGISGYGFDEAEWKVAVGKEENKDDTTETVVVKEVNDLAVSDDMAPEARVELLKSRFPEFEGLSIELHTLHQEHARMKEELASPKTRPLSTVALMKTQFRSLGAYLSALAMYFVILTSPAASTTTSDSNRPLAKAPAEMHGHPIMADLVRCRELWQLMRNIETPSSDGESDQSDEEMAALEDLSDGSMSDIESELTVVSSKKPKSRKTHSQRKSARAARAVQDAKANKVHDTLSSLENLITSASQSRKKTASAEAPSSLPKRTSKSIYVSRDDDDDDDDLGEPEQLTEAEMREKNQKRRSVRFHMSQIHQREIKDNRGTVNGEGDDDIPYRERWRDRLERLNKEAEARGRKQAQGKEALGSRDSDSEGDDNQISRSKSEKSLIPASTGGDEDDEYYDMVAARRSSKVSQKQDAAAALAAAKAADGVVVPVEEIGPDGKRKITYQIEKNRGLTPNRRKTIKNPRVKKRVRYEEKMKKLKSTRAVYGGGEAKGGYDGEKTGIKAGLVRSRKL